MNCERDIELIPPEYILKWIRSMEDEGFIHSKVLGMDYEELRVLQATNFQSYFQNSKNTKVWKC